MNRRELLRILGGAVACTSLPAPGDARGAESSESGLGVVIYALNLQRAAMRKGASQGDLFEPLTFLEFCHDLGAGGVQVPLGIRDEPYARRLRERALRYGMFIEGIASPPQRDSDTDRFEAEIRTARQCGVDVLRTVIMPGRRYERFDSLEEFRTFVDRGKQALQRAAPIAERHRVRLAVENHKDQRVDERIELLKQIGSEYVGVCVDVGNSFALLEDPTTVVEAFAPWAFAVHIKDQMVQPYDDGFLFADAPLGSGFLMLKEMVETLRRAKPDIHFCLETITRDPLKVPCLAEKYWATFPDVPGSDLARTLRMVRDHEAATLSRPSELEPADQVALELENVRRSLAYARDPLGV